MKLRDAHEPRGVRRIALAALLLAGCAAVGPDYAPPQSDAPAEWAHAIEADERRTVDLESWWNAFEDPQLTSLIERALASNPSFDIARSRLLEARALLGVARSARLPQIDANAAFDRSRRSTESLNGAPFFGRRENSLWDVGFDARWELDVFGGLTRELEAAIADAQALEEARRGTMASVAAEVALAYVELRAAQQRLDTARQRIAVQAETAEIVVERARAGVASDLDSTRARAQVATAKSDEPAFAAQVEQQIHRLGVLLGVEPRALADELSAPQSIPSARLRLAVEQPLSVLARRPDVRQAERACAAASARVGAAVAELYPRISLGAGFGWLANDAGDLFRNSAIAANVSPGVSLPLFDGGLRRAQVEAASTREEQALAQHRATVLGALEDVESSLATLAAAAEQRASLRDAVGEQRQAAELARQLYVAGVRDFLTVLDAERERFSLEDRFLVSERDVAVRFVALAKALGGGWSDGDDAKVASR